MVIELVLAEKYVVGRIFCRLLRGGSCKGAAQWEGIETVTNEFDVFWFFGFDWFPVSESQCSSGYSPLINFEISDMDRTIPKLIELGAHLDGPILHQPYGKVRPRR